MFFLEVGLLLIVVPWSIFWERNYFADLLPPFRGILQSPFVRGAVSGLGLVNLGVGLLDLANLVAARRGGGPVRASGEGAIEPRLASEK